MNKNAKLKFSAAPDRRLLGARGGDRHLLIDVDAPHIEREDGESPPLSLALVIDASGSMSGPPIGMARRAAVEVANSLGPDDRLSVLSFADEVLVHVDGLAMDEAGKREACGQIGRIGPRGCTDLAAGWTRGADLAAKHGGDGWQMRVILLSDGHANMGETDPEILGLKAADMRQRGVYTSTVGIGDGYSPTQLNTMAENGGGQIHRAARADQIEEVVTGELGQIREIAADDVRIRIEHGKDASIEVLGPFPVTPGDGCAEISLGSLVSGAVRKVVARVSLPQGDEGSVEKITVVPGWVPAGGKKTVSGEPIAIELHRVPAIELAAEVPDPDVGLAVATAWRDSLVLRATAMIEDGAQDQAGEMVENTLREFRDYCRDIPGAEKLATGLTRFRRRLRTRFSAQLMCEASTMVGKALAHCEDYRADFSVEDIQRDLGLEE